MPPKALPFVLVIFGLLFVLANSLFIVSQTNQALVFQFREVKQVVKDPGLHFKVPFIQDIDYIEKRVLPYDLPSQEVILADRKRLEIDAFARYRIADPLLYFQRLRNERVAESRLTSVVNSSMRAVMGKAKLQDLLSPERTRIMAEIRRLTNEEAKDLGLAIVDVRIRRADLPRANSEATFARMRAERQQEAQEIRAKGNEAAQKIRAEADRDRVITLAEARQKSEMLRGEGDNTALKIIGEATSKDPQFYAFYRSLFAYRKALNSENTSYVLSPDSQFFRFFKQSGQ